MRLSREIYEQIVEHALQEAPNECCGMLSGRDGEAVRAYRASNVQASPFRFEIDPAEQIKIHNAIEDEGLDLGAIYHSHTRTEPRPSQADINFAKNWPGVVWIIVGLAEGEPDVRGFLIDGAAVTQTDLLVA